MSHSPKMAWIAVENRLPKIGQEVLCFYTIDKFQYYVVGKITQITTVQRSEEEQAHRIIEWNNAHYDVIEPTHWLPLEPPDEGG